jgi:hypothetical protein
VRCAASGARHLSRARRSPQHLRGNLQIIDEALIFPRLGVGITQQMRRRAVIGKPKPLPSRLSCVPIPLEALISLVKHEVINPD